MDEVHHSHLHRYIASLGIMTERQHYSAKRETLAKMDCTTPRQWTRQIHVVAITLRLQTPQYRVLHRQTMPMEQEMMKKQLSSMQPLRLWIPRGSRPTYQWTDLVALSTTGRPRVAVLQEAAMLLQLHLKLGIVVHRTNMNIKQNLKSNWSKTAKILMKIYRTMNLFTSRGKIKKESPNGKRKWKQHELLLNRSSSKMQWKIQVIKETNAIKTHFKEQMLRDYRVLRIQLQIQSRHRDIVITQRSCRIQEQGTEILLPQETLSDLLPQKRVMINMLSESK